MPPLRVQLLKAREEEKLDFPPGEVRRNGAVLADGRRKQKFVGSSAPSDDDDCRRRRRWLIPIPTSLSDLRHSRTKTMSNAGSLLTSTPSDTARSSFSTSTSDRDSPPASADPLASAAPPRRPYPAPRPPRSEWKLLGTPTTASSRGRRHGKIGTVRDTLTAESSDTETDEAAAAGDGGASNDERQRIRAAEENSGSFVGGGIGRRTNSSDTSAAGVSPASSSPLSIYGGWDGSDCDSEKIIVKSGSCGRATGQQRLSAVRRSLEAAFALSSSEYRRNAIAPKADLSIIGDFDGASAAVASDSSSSPDFADMQLPEWLGVRRRGSRRRKGRETSPGNLVLALHPADATAENCRKPSADRCRTPAMGLLRCIGSDGGSGFRSCYTLRLPDSNEMLLASLSERGAGGRRVYTFFAGNMSNKGGSRRRSPVNGWMTRKQDVGRFENSSRFGAIAAELQIAAKMVVTTNLQLRSGGGGAIYMVSEFVLFEAAATDVAAPAANTAVRTQSSRLASTLSAALLRINQSASYVASATAETSIVHSSFRRRSHPELAAVVIHTDVVGSGSPSGNSTVTMVVPTGSHSMPAGSSGPRTLIERWKSGGSCDCGGWDVGCGIKVLGSNLQGSEGGCGGGGGGGAAWPEAAAAISLMAENEGNTFALRFQSNRVTPLAAFAAAVATLHNEEVLAAPPPEAEHDEDPVRLDWTLT